MAESLIDLGGMTNNAIQLGQLAQQQERNQMYGESVKQQAQYHQQIERFKAFDELEKQRVNPAIALDENMQASITQKQFSLLGQEPPSADQLKQNMNLYKNFVGTVRDKGVADPDVEKMWWNIAAVNPTYAKQQLELMSGKQKLTTEAQDAYFKLQQHGPSLQILQDKAVRETYNTKAYAGIHGHLQDTEALFSNVAPIWEKLSAPPPEGLKNALRSTPQAIAYKESMAAQGDALQKQRDAYQSELVKHESLLRRVNANDLDIPPGETKAGLEEKVQADALRVRSLDAALEFTTDPFSREAYKGFQQATSEVNLARSKSQRALADIKQTQSSAAERLAFNQNQDAYKRDVSVAESFAQEKFIGYLNQGMKDNVAAGRALADSRKKFGDKIPIDATKLRNPEKPAVETNVNMYNEKPNVAEAGKIASLEQSFEEMGKVRGHIINEDGSVSRRTLFASALNIPFTSGRDVNTFVSKAVEAKLRAATGAAAPQPEVEKYTKDYGPSVKDSDELIIYKLDAMEEWLKATVDITDPLGSLRKRSNALLSPGVMSKLNSPEYKSLRKKYPQDSSLELMKYLQRREAEKK